MVENVWDQINAAVLHTTLDLDVKMVNKLVYIALDSVLIMILALCDTAECSPPCQNGGQCVAPNVCLCPVGWTGPQCAEG